MTLYRIAAAMAKCHRRISEASQLREVSGDKKDA